MAKKKVRAKAKAKTKAKTKAKPKAKVRTKTKPVRAKAKTKRPASAKPKVAKSPTVAKTETAAAPTPTVSALPDLEVQTTGGGRLQLSSLKGKNVVLYFYPKDDTPGCTTEGCDLRDHHGEFQNLNTVILGVSRDSVESHERFKAKYNFPFELVSDPEEKLCRALGVIQQKSRYGQTYMGVDRSTFIFDKDGKLRKEFRGVSVPGHIDQILEEVRKL